MSVSNFKFSEKMKASFVFAILVLSIYQIICTNSETVMDDRNCDSRSDIYNGKKLEEEVKKRTESKLEDERYRQQRKQQLLKRGKYFEQHRYSKSQIVSRAQ